MPFHEEAGRKQEMNPTVPRRLASKGEGPTLEFKRSTGELRAAMEALGGLLNTTGKGRSPTVRNGTSQTPRAASSRRPM
jgi:hypothetical protein